MLNGAAPRKIAMPWYEENDFASICALGEWPGVTSSYEQWRRKATAELLQAAGAGYPIEIVTIRSDSYRRWLGSNRNSSEARRRYVALRTLGRLPA